MVKRVANDHKSLRASMGSLIRSSKKTGTKAGENEPSANRSLKTFGTLKATKKASVKPEAPNTAA
jgi:translation elongation factor EF-Ts